MGETLPKGCGKQSLYVYDGTGNPIALLTDDSYQAFGYKYDPYGVPVLTQSSGGSGVSQNPYLFKTGVQDRTTGWVHFGARWYDPSTGRFTQQDTLDMPLDPANANRYAYAADDPINNSDPTGLSVNWTQIGSDTVALGAGLVIGTAVAGAICVGVVTCAIAPYVGGAVGGYLGDQTASAIFGTQSDPFMSIVNGIAGAGATP